MNSATDTYTKKVWDFLGKMKPGDSYVVAQICEPKNTVRFIAAIKKYMESLPMCGWICFNKDYSMFYMTATVPEEELRGVKHSESDV